MTPSERERIKTLAQRAAIKVRDKNGKVFRFRLTWKNDGYRIKIARAQKYTLIAYWDLDLWLNDLEVLERPR